MNNNAVNQQNENNTRVSTEKTSEDYQRKFDFYDAKLERTKKLLTEITMFTSGVFVPPKEKDWIFPYLLELIKIFELVEDVYLIGDFVSDLEIHLFSEHPKYYAKKNKWIEKTIFKSADLSEFYAGQINADSEQNADDFEPESPETISEPTEKETTSQLAAKVFHSILEHTGIPDKVVSAIYSAFKNIYDGLAPERKAEITDERDTVAYLELIFRTSAEDEAAEKTKKSEDENLARQISAIMTNPLLPEHLRNVIADEINEADEVDDFSPETVLHNLNVIREKETAFIPNLDTVPSISEIPHSKPSSNRTHKPKIKKRPAKPAKQGKKDDDAK